MPAEITMPQLSDTMKEGTLVRWLKKEGDKIAEGDILAEVETDKANMEMEAFDSGTLAYIIVGDGGKADVGAVLAVIATGSEKPDQVKAQYGTGGTGAQAKSADTPATPAADAKKPATPSAAKPEGAAVKSSAPSGGRNQFELIVIGGGPAGYAAAIRAGQLKKRVLCIEMENLGGTCLNWGCIPTKALLEDGNFVRKIRTEAEAHGVKFSGLEIDFAKMISRSRGIAEKLAKGIAHLFKKYLVQHEQGIGTVLGSNRVRITLPDGQTKEVTADKIIVAVGARATQLPGMEFDGKKIIAAREAMTLPKQPKRLAIVGAGAIGCEFADFYNAVGTEVIIVEMMDHLLPIEDPEVSVMLERIFTKRGIQVYTKTKTDRVEKTASGVKLHLSGAKSLTVEADVLLLAAGVTGNVEKASTPESGLEIVRNRIKVGPTYQTSLKDVWAVGDCVAIELPGKPLARHPDLAHVAHHEAVQVVERIFGHEVSPIDYNFIPGCTYTHPQVASMGYTEAKAREAGYEIKVGKFPFGVSGRALAAGETDGFVKLIFDAKYGELLGVHMIGEHVTELLAELVLARKLEATEAEIIEAMHPHPTLSEAVMEAAGVADGRAIHL